MLGNLLHTVESLIDFLVALELEGNGDDADGQDASIFGTLSNDGSRTCTGAAAHACRDEHHACAVVEHRLDVFDALLSPETPHSRVVACPKAVLAQLQVIGDRRVAECLLIRVAHDIGHVVYAFAVHVVDGIAATAAYAHHLDDARVLRLTEIEVDASHGLYCLIFCHSYVVLGVKRISIYRLLYPVHRKASSRRSSRCGQRQTASSP